MIEGDLEFTYSDNQESIVVSIGDEIYNDIDLDCEWFVENSKLHVLVTIRDDVMVGMIFKKKVNKVIYHGYLSEDDFVIMNKRELRVAIA